MKKCLVNLYVGGIEYKAGEVYKAEDVAHIDQSNFIDLEVPENTPVVSREEIVNELGEDKVKEIEENATPINNDEETSTSEGNVDGENENTASSNENDEESKENDVLV